MIELSFSQKLFAVAKQQNLSNFTSTNAYSKPTIISTGMEKLKIMQRASKTRGYTVFLIFHPKQQILMSLSALKQQYLNSILNQIPQTPFRGGFSQPITASTARAIKVMMEPLTMKRVATTRDENLYYSFGRKVLKLKTTIVRKKREPTQKLLVMIVHRKRLPKVVATLLAMMAEGIFVNKSTSQQPINEKQSRRVKNGIFPIYSAQLMRPSLLASLF